MLTFEFLEVTEKDWLLSFVRECRFDASAGRPLGKAVLHLKLIQLMLQQVKQRLNIPQLQEVLRTED